MEWFLPAKTQHFSRPFDKQHIQFGQLGFAGRPNKDSTNSSQHKAKFWLILGPPIRSFSSLLKLSTVPGAMIRRICHYGKSTLKAALIRLLVIALKIRPLSGFLRDR